MGLFGRRRRPTVPDFPPSRMVAILLAPLLVPPRHLYMSKRVGTDPYRGPGRRDHQGLDTPQRLNVSNPRPLGVTIGEAATGLWRVIPGLSGKLGRGMRIEHPDHRGVFRMSSTSTHLRNLGGFFATF